MRLTSAVQAPELLGWKKFSVDMIIRARESRAFDPARYVFNFTRCIFFNSGEDR